GIEVACNAVCRHVTVGGVVWQFITPGSLPDSWQKTLDSNGPCIHDDFFLVDNVQEVKAAMLDRGCKLIGDMDWPMSAFFPGAPEDQRVQGCWIDATEQCGLRFELGANINDENGDPATPCLTGRQVNSTTFQHSEIVHPDPVAAARFMQDVLGAETCEPELSAGIEVACNAVCRHVTVGGVVWQFITPGSLPDSWQKTLDSNGPCVHDVHFFVDDEPATKTAMLERGCKLIGDMDWPVSAFLPGAPEDLRVQGSWIDATEQCGLRFELAMNVFDESGKPVTPSGTGVFV
ncbi:MAG: hypothetical protein KJ792_14255, partial [Actinobacteria bacterium]|nr:hypothetical protein [Actinomycetota bacterium]